ncbi:hypothetical protein BaRGS_00008024 [Batillaria attramentaria]|uniref:WD repeat protein mio zinc-ribbon like domain-containing protein n=1 Tax=Batillaria attramentaria TaxID=370345 RepID=A0ABD0LMP3_9CAEN
MSGGKVEVLWSPTDDNTFITCGSAINLYQVETSAAHHKHPETTLRISDDKYAVHCAANSEIHFIKCAAWYPKAEPKNLLAVGQANGRVVLTRYYQMSDKISLPSVHDMFVLRLLSIAETVVFVVKTVRESFGDPGDDELIGKEFVPRHSRQCNFLAWNPEESHLLTEGLEKFRNDACIVIWDITSSHMTSDNSERSRYSSSEHGSVTRPCFEIGPGDTCSSFAWFPQDARTFVTGVNNRYLRVYDLRDTVKPRLVTPHRTVCGVCVDALDSRRLASFGESQVAVWDVRSFDRPILTFQESKPVAKISWCLTRPGMLCVLCKESPSIRLYDIRHAVIVIIRDSTLFQARPGMLSVLCKESPSIRLYDIRHAVIGSDDIEPVTIDRNVQPCGQNPLSSFAWHPRHENRLLAIVSPNQMRDMVIFERMPLAWSPQFNLTWANGKRTMNCVFGGPFDKLDISARMRQRALAGYGMQAENILHNALIVAEEKHLQGLWKWISLVRQCQRKPAPSSKRGPVYNMGVKQILKYYTDQSNTMESDQAYVQWQPSDGVAFSIKHHYRSQERSLALALCGWIPDTNPTEFNIYLDNLTENGEVEKAAAIAIFTLKMKKALGILSSSAAGATNNGNPSLNAVAMALAGYNENSNTLWRRTCGTQRFQLSNPYLRAIFAFLACDTEFYADVLEETEMAVQDRVAFALTYLPDAKLKDYIEKLTDELVESGDLDGMLLTGLSSEGIDLLERYVDNTSDIQTAAITAVFSGTAQSSKDDRVQTWIYNYRMLLDQWALWHQRARFDNVMQMCEPGVQVPPQVYISCNYCGKSLNSSSRGFRLPDRMMFHNPFARTPQQQRHKISCCPSCRKALPRCSVCLGLLGTASNNASPGEHPSPKAGQPKLSPHQDWFSWCQTCRHGGHAGHITEWFREHVDCPVTGCTCRCMAIDSAEKAACS